MENKEVWNKPTRAERKEILRKESDERKKEHDKLTILQKIEKIDARLGPNVGAKKERARLKEMLEAQAEAEERAKKVKKVEKEEDGKPKAKKKPQRKKATKKRSYKKASKKPSKKKTTSSR